VIEVRAGGFRLPPEIRAALNEPRLVRLIPAEDGYLLTRAGRFEPLVNLARPVLGRRAWPLARRADAGRYCFVGARAIPDGRYGVANHGHRFFLMARDEDPATGRERYWASLEGYHEHLEPEAQDAGAKALSEAFVRDWLLPTGGRSFLELGCGAGRNLVELRRQRADADLRGVDANADGVAVARAAVPGADIEVGSLYELGAFADDSADVVFTAGVLMHIPHDHVEAVVREMLRIARVAVVHSELHGARHEFDFHRYPRDYGALYAKLGLPCRYAVEPLTDGTGGERALLSAVDLAGVSPPPQARQAG
jgi:SAM-dependent methyltransferase